MSFKAKAGVGKDARQANMNKIFGSIQWPDVCVGCAAKGDKKKLKVITSWHKAALQDSKKATIHEDGYVRTESCTVTTKFRLCHECEEKALENQTQHRAAQVKSDRKAGVIGIGVVFVLFSALALYVYLKNPDSFWVYVALWPPLLFGVMFIIAIVQFIRGKFEVKLSHTPDMYYYRDYISQAYGHAPMNNYYGDDEYPDELMISFTNKSYSKIFLEMNPLLKKNFL